MGAKQTSHLHVENVSNEEVTLDVQWGNETSKRVLPPMTNATCEGRPGAERIKVTAAFEDSGGELEFNLDERDLRTHATHAQIGVANGVGTARVNGAVRPCVWREGRVGRDYTVSERKVRRAPSPLAPRPTPLVRLNPRIVGASAPAVLPRHPAVLDADRVSSAYAFDFGPEIEVLKEEGFAVECLSHGGDAPRERAESPVPASDWAR